MATETIYTEILNAGLVSGPEATYAAAHDAASADSITAKNNPHKVGQAKEGDTGFYVYRTCLIFNCANLKGATASSAKVTLYQSDSSINDAQSMYIVTGADVADTGVVLADFGDLLDDTTSWGSATSAYFIGTAGDKDITLNTAGLAALQTAMDAGGLVKLAFRSGHDINNTPDAGYIERNFFSFYGPEDITPARRPRLVVTYKASLPSDDLTRVAGIRHIYRPGFFRMQLTLGDVSNTIEIAEAKVRKELEIPEQQTPYIPTPRDWEPQPRWEPPKPAEPTIVPPAPIPTTSARVTPSQSGLPPPIPMENVFGTGEYQQRFPEPKVVLRRFWRSITPWKEESGETFGSEFTERFRRMFGGRG